MIAWWDGLTAVQRIFAFMAVPATVILMLQNLLLMFGAGGGHDADGEIDFDSDSETDYDLDGDSGGHDSGLRIFTVRAFVAFFTVFGWCGIVLTSSGVNTGLSVLISACGGFLMMVVIAYIFKLTNKLQSEGNIDAANAVGKSGTVYLTIPKERSGRGKVMVTVQERLTEMEAVTDCDKSIKTGSEITVVSVSNQGILCVVPRK